MEVTLLKMPNTCTAITYHVQAKCSETGSVLVSYGHNILNTTFLLAEKRDETGEAKDSLTKYYRLHTK